jgi:hypothetical protein
MKAGAHSGESCATDGGVVDGGGVGVRWWSWVVEEVEVVVGGGV